MNYGTQMRAVLTPAEIAVFSRLSTPLKIQDYLDSLPINFEMQGETYLSPREVIKRATAHCFEGAVLAAAALAFHGGSALLLDLKARKPDVDHVVALFRQNGYWGAISKTNRALLRWRDPVYESPREIALSYFNEYFLDDGTKTLVSYSRPFDLSKYAPKKWLTAGEDLDDIALALDKSRHFPLVPANNRRLLRKASKTEIAAMKIVEWKEPRGYKNGT